MLVSWFTYELLPRVEGPDGDSSLGDDKQRWLSAQGPYAGSVAELDVIATIEGGFGKKKAERYGKGLVEILKSFYEAKPVHSKTSNKKEDK